MKKNLSPRKKYANGSNTQGVIPNNYISTPNEVLNDYNIMLAKVDQEVANNKAVPIVSLVGGILQKVIGSVGGAAGGGGEGTGIGTAANIAKVNTATNPSTSKIMVQGAEGVISANGNNNVNSDVEVEGGEKYETPQGQVGEFEGPSHEQNGIPLKVTQDPNANPEEGQIQEGTKVYSNRLKIGKETLAERKENRENQTDKLEKAATEPLIDQAIKNALKRKMQAIQKEEIADLEFQDQVNNMQQMADSVIAAFGTSVDGLQENPIGESMRYANGTNANGVTEYGDGTDEYGIPIPQYDEFGNLISPESTDLFTPQFTTPGVNASTPYSVNKTYATVEEKPDAPGHMKNLEQSPIPTFANNFNTVLPSAPSDYGAGAFLKSFDNQTEAAITPAAGAGKETLLGAAFSNSAGAIKGTLGKIGGAISKDGMPSIGDMAGLFGDYLGTTSGLKNAAEQRSTDITHRNTMANAGKESQKQLDNAMSSIEASKAQAIVKATTTTQGGKKSGRNSARGVNQMRGMDWLYDTALNEQIASISANAASQVSDIYKTKSSVALTADQLKGEGQYKADMANEAAKDAYYTAKGQGLKDQSLGIQNIGKDLNAMKQDKMIEKLMKSGYGKWTGLDSQMNTTNKNTVAETANNNVEIPDGKGGKISMTQAEFQKLMNQVTKTK